MVPLDTPQVLPALLPTTAPGDDIAVFDHARYHDTARRLIMQQTLAEIAADFGMSARQMRRVVKRPAFLLIYREVHDEMMANLDPLIQDERIAPLLRAKAQSIRMQTVLQEVVDEIRDRIKQGTAKATEMKVVVDAAFGIIDRAKTELSNVQTKGGGGVDVNVALTVTGASKQIISETLGESGLDLSDIIDVEPLDDTA